LSKKKIAESSRERALKGKTRGNSRRVGRIGKETRSRKKSRILHLNQNKIKPCKKRPTHINVYEIDEDRVISDNC